MLSLDVLCLLCYENNNDFLCSVEIIFRVCIFNINYFFIFQKDFGDFLPFGVLPTLMEQVLI